MDGRDGWMAMAIKAHQNQKEQNDNGKMWICQSYNNKLLKLVGNELDLDYTHLLRWLCVLYIYSCIYNLLSDGHLLVSHGQSSCTFYDNYTVFVFIKILSTWLFQLNHRKWSHEITL